MPTKTLPKSGSSRRGALLEQQARTQILIREHHTASLAKACGVSVATMSRALARLRKKLSKEGLELISVRSPAGSHYEIKGEMERRRRAILKLIEEMKSWPVDPPVTWKAEDRLIYEADRPSR